MTEITIRACMMKCISVTVASWLDLNKQFVNGHKLLVNTLEQNLPMEQLEPKATVTFKVSFM